MGSDVNLSVSDDAAGLGKGIAALFKFLEKGMILHSNNPAVKQKKLEKARLVALKGVAKQQKYLEKIREDGALEVSIVNDSNGLENGTIIEPEAIERLLVEAYGSVNTAKVIMKALPTISESEKARVDDIDLDWLSLFADLTKTVFDSDMQDAWSAVLSNKASRPGEIPKRTLFTLAGLSKDEAASFLELLKTTPWGPDLYVFDIRDKYYWGKGVNFNFLINAGLVEEVPRGWYTTVIESTPELIEMMKDAPLSISAGDDSLFIYKDESLGLDMPVGRVKFTPEGLALSRSITVKQYDDLSVHLKEVLEKQPGITRVEIEKDGRLHMLDRIKSFKAD